MARVLYVEDHADTRDAIAELLRRAGYEVETAGNGNEALACAFARTPDVILLDLALPELDGAKLIEVLRSYLRLALLPIVVLSGMGTGSLFEQAKALNPSSILIKGRTGFDQILAAIRNALTQPPSARFAGQVGKPAGEPPRSRSG